MKTSGVWVEIVSQISEVCLLSERALIRMQWSLLVAPAAVSVGGVRMVLFTVLLESGAASVLQVKRQLRQTNGPLVVVGEA